MIDPYDYDPYEDLENFVRDNPGKFKVQTFKGGLKKVTFKVRDHKMLMDAIEIDKQEAIDAGSLGFLHRGLALCSMPYKNITGKNTYKRTNGHFTLSITSDAQYGIPYGNIPRLIHIYLATEAVKKQNPVISLGENISEFMQRLNLTVCGGEHGVISRLKNQIQRMVYSTIFLIYETPNDQDTTLMSMASGVRLLWDAEDPKKKLLWHSTITLGTDYFNDLIQHPIPLDLRVANALKRASLELDIYFWLSHRLFYIKTPSVIPYDLLRVQFGSEYKRVRAFKENFLKALKNVKRIWWTLNVSDEGYGLKIAPSKMLVKPKKRA